MLSSTDPRKQLVTLAAGHLHAGQTIDAGRAIADFSGVKTKVETIARAHDIVFPLLHWCFANNGYEEAAELLWPKTLFNPEPRSTKMIWSTFERSSSMIMMGAASMSKSYSTGVRLFLEWVRDPEYTNVKVIGPSEDHLESNLFTHLVTLHQSASLPMPGTVAQLFIGLNPRSRKSSIQGVVVPIGKKSAGRLQGAKRHPRPKPHPVFGDMSRLFVFLDEFENIPIGIFRDLDNILSNIDGVDGFKIMGAYNPSDPNSPVASRVEPADGWQSFDLETSECWRSKRGWDVVRLDAYKCENVVSGRVIFPGLQTKEGLARLIENAGGVNTPGWYTMARAAYPPLGTNYSVIPEKLLDNIRGTAVFIEKPNKCAGVDIALEGGDTAKMVLGRFGLSSGINYAPSPAFPHGLYIPFVDSKKRVQPRQIAQVDKMVTLPPAPTVQMAAEIRRILQSAGVEPEWVVLDRTGNGAGVHDVLREFWSGSVRGVNYSEKASDRKIAVEDLDTAENIYERMVSELQFAMRKWIEFGYVVIDPSVEFSELKSQLTGRLFAPGKKHKVESKRDYKSRGNKSPDEADALSLFIHAVRFASGVLIGVLPANVPGYASDEDSADYCRIGCTDRISDDI